MAPGTPYAQDRGGELMPKQKQTADERLDDALADAEMFLGSTIEELEQTLKDMRKAKQALHMQRMTLARKIKDHKVATR